MVIIHHHDHNRNRNRNRNHNHNHNILNILIMIHTINTHTTNQVIIHHNHNHNHSQSHNLNQVQMKMMMVPMMKQVQKTMNTVKKQQHPNQSPHHQHLLHKMKALTRVKMKANTQKIIQKVRNNQNKNNSSIPIEIIIQPTELYSLNCIELTLV